MKRAIILPVEPEALALFPTGKLLARLRQLRQCEESLACSDRDAPAEDGSIEFKDSPCWAKAWQELRTVLAGREHVDRPGSRRAGARPRRRS